MKKSIIILIVIFILAATGYRFTHRTGSQADTLHDTTASTSVEYANTQYGFRFDLPESWRDYSIATDTWRGDTFDESKGNVEATSGPEILIRHPLWTESSPRQDIPIMIFTLSQWDSLLRDQFHIGAAPVNPTRLAVNSQYVFALPARYNYAFQTGYEEVGQILANNPIHSLPDSGTPTSDEKILLCGGIPNGTSLTVRETTRLSINLPRDTYPDKDHNLEFQTASGNASASWISNAGPYGEAFQATPECFSYYYEFDGTGTLDLHATSSVSGAPDYLVHFEVTAAE